MRPMLEAIPGTKGTGKATIAVPPLRYRLVMATYWEVGLQSGLQSVVDSREQFSR